MSEEVKQSRLTIGGIETPYVILEELVEEPDLKDLARRLVYTGSYDEALEAIRVLRILLEASKAGDLQLAEIVKQMEHELHGRRVAEWVVSMEEKTDAMYEKVTKARKILDGLVHAGRWLKERPGRVRAWVLVIVAVYAKRRPAAV